MGIPLDGWACNGSSEVALTNGPTSLVNNKSIHLARPDAECSFKYKPYSDLDLPELHSQGAINWEENWDDPEHSCVVTIVGDRFKSDKTGLGFHEEQSHTTTIIESTETLSQSNRISAKGYEDAVFSYNQIEISKYRMDQLTASIENEEERHRIDEQPRQENCTEPSQSEPLDVALEQSNSEDSSLSDSDRTLVGDPPSTDDYPPTDDFCERRHAIADDVHLGYRRNAVSEPREFYFQAFPNNDEPQRCEFFFFYSIVRR